MTTRRRYPAYRPSGIEWLGEIPAHWDVRRFKSVIASSVNGIWGDEPQGDDNDLVCIRVADFDYANLKVSSNNLTIRNIDPKQQRTRLLLQGDLLIEKSGGGDIWPVGRVVSYQLDNSAVCSNFIANLGLRDTAENRFMTYLFHAAYAVALNTRSIKQTTGIQNIDLSSYLNEVFSLPPLPEQRAIATFLDRETARIDALIAKKQRLIELLQEKRTALISQAVTKGLDADTPIKDSGIEWLGEIPAHWDVQRVKHLSSKIGSGKTPRGGSEVYQNSGVIFIRSQNVHFNGLRVDDIVHINEKIDREMANTRVIPGDVLLNITGASLGRVAVVPDRFPPANVNQHVCIIRPNGSVHSHFLHAAFASIPVQHQIFSTESGAAREGLPFTKIANIVLGMPPSVEEQRAIAAFLDREASKLDTLVAKIQTAIEKFQEYRTALISAAVTGKIDVRKTI